jgi:hypothetical protein
MNEVIANELILGNCHELAANKTFLFDLESVLCNRIEYIVNGFPLDFKLNTQKWESIGSKEMEENPFEFGHKEEDTVETNKLPNLIEETQETQISIEKINKLPQIIEETQEEELNVYEDSMDMSTQLDQQEKSQTNVEDMEPSQINLTPIPQTQDVDDFMTTPIRGAFIETRETPDIVIVGQKSKKRALTPEETQNPKRKKSNSKSIEIL